MKRVRGPRKLRRKYHFFARISFGKGNTRENVYTMLSKMSLSATRAINSLFVGFSVPM